MSGREFPRSEFEGRWKKASQLMKENGLDALFITERTNYFYYTGHHSYQFEHKMRPMLTILPRDSEPVMIIYKRDESEARTDSWVADMRTYVDVPFPTNLVSETLSSLGLEKAVIGCELGVNQRLGLPYNEFMAITESVPEAQFVDGTKVIAKQRIIKTEAELQLIQKACDISLSAWDKLLSQLRVGMTTTEAQKLLTCSMIEEGADIRHPGFSMWTLSGAEHTYKKGDIVWCDFGATYKGYHADFARRAVFGQPTQKQLDEHALCWDNLKKMIDAMRPGIKISEIAKLSNSELVKAGYPAPSPIKRVGHGLGMDLSEPPSINEVDHTILEVGMVLTPEPRFFVSETERVQIEEDIVITENGCRMLTVGAEKLYIIDC